MSAPVTDADPVAGVREALAGGRLALGRERGVAAYLEGKYPGFSRLVLAAHRFHRAAALWTVRRPARPLDRWSFAAAGYPPPGVPLHAWAASAGALGPVARPQGCRHALESGEPLKSVSRSHAAR